MCCAGDKIGNSYEIIGPEATKLKKFLTKTTENETKEQRGEFLDMSLGNLISGKAIIIAADEVNREKEMI